MRKKYYEDAVKHGEVPILSSKKNYGEWASILKENDIVLAVWGDIHRIIDIVPGFVKKDDQDKSSGFKIELLRDVLHYDDCHIKIIKFHDLYDLCDETEYSTVKLYLINDFLGNYQRNVIMRLIANGGTCERYYELTDVVYYDRYEYKDIIIDSRYSIDTGNVSFVLKINNMTFSFGRYIREEISQESECTLLYCHKNKTSAIARIDEEYLAIAAQAPLTPYSNPIKVMKYPTLNMAWKFIADSANDNIAYKHSSTSSKIF